MKTKRKLTQEEIGLCRDFFKGFCPEDDFHLYVDDLKDCWPIESGIDLINNPMTGEIRGGYADYAAGRAWNQE